MHSEQAFEAVQIDSQKVALGHHYSQTKANDSLLNYEKPTCLQEPQACGVDSKLSVLKHVHKMKMPIYSVLVNGNAQSRFYICLVNSEYAYFSIILCSTL